MKTIFIYLYIALACVVMFGCQLPNAELSSTVRNQVFFVNCSRDREIVTQRILEYIATDLTSPRDGLTPIVNGETITGTFRFQVDHQPPVVYYCDSAYVVRVNNGTIEIKLIVKRIFNINYPEYRLPEEIWGNFTGEINENFGKVVSDIRNIAM